MPISHAKGDISIYYYDKRFNDICLWSQIDMVKNIKVKVTVKLQKTFILAYRSVNSELQYHLKKQKQPHHQTQQNKSCGTQQNIFNK